MHREEQDELRRREVQALEGLGHELWRRRVAEQLVPVQRPGLRTGFSGAVPAGVVFRAFPGLAERFRAVPAEHLSPEGLRCVCGALTPFPFGLFADCAGGCGRMFCGTERGASSFGPVVAGPGEWSCAGCGAVNDPEDRVCWSCDGPVA